MSFRRAIFPLLGFSRLVATMALASALGWLLPPAAAESALTTDNESYPVTVGVMRLGFAHMSENDARAAILALAKQLSDKLGYTIATRVAIFDDPLQLRDACRAGQVQLVLAGTWDFLAMDIFDLVQNLYVTQTSGTTRHAWRLVARNDNVIHSLADLRGKRVLVLHNGMAHLGQPWLETLCLARGLGSVEHYFRQVETTTKPSGALLPVFFSKFDACVIDEVSLDLVSQLNPQVPAQLATLETSEPLSNAIVGLSRLGWRTDQMRDEIARLLAVLHEEPAGQQILTLFRCERIVPCPPHQLDSVVKLFQLNRRLSPVTGTP